MKFSVVLSAKASLLPVQLLAATGPAVQSRPGLSTEDIRDIKSIIVQPGFDPLWYWAGSALLLLVIGAGLFLYRKKLHRRKQQQIQAHERALNALESIRVLIDKKKSRAFAVRAADILRQYIEDRFHFALQHLTTREFLSSLLKNPERFDSDLCQHDQMLRDWMNHCDLIKFAGYGLSREDMEAMYASVAEFIEATRIKGEEQ